jgi:hypothetical protein
MRRPPLPALALSAALLAGCTHPDGTTDWGSTLALGAGAAAVVGLVALAANDRDRTPSYAYQRGRGYGHGRPPYGHYRRY